MGLHIDVPPIIGSLARKLLTDNSEFLFFVLSAEMLMLLDIEGIDARRPSFNWWDDINVRPIPY